MAASIAFCLASLWREIDAVDEAAGRVGLAEQQVDHRPLGARLVGGRRHHLLEVDLLERREGGARVLLHLELGLGEDRGAVALVGVGLELGDGFLAALGGLGAADDPGDAAVLVGEAEGPDDDAGEAEGQRGDDGLRPPRGRQDEGQHPRDRDGDAEAEPHLLERLGTHRVGRQLLVARGRDELFAESLRIGLLLRLVGRHSNRPSLARGRPKGIGPSP
jgi:hypothetical protein